MNYCLAYRNSVSHAKCRPQGHWAKSSETPKPGGTHPWPRSLRGPRKHAGILPSRAVQLGEEAGMGCGERAQPALNSPWVLSPLTQQTRTMSLCTWGGGMPALGQAVGRRGHKAQALLSRGQAAGCEKMNSTTGLPPHLHRGRPQSGGGVRGCSLWGSTQGRVLPSEAKSPLPALSGEWRWDRHAWSHLWTSCTGSSDKPLTQGDNACVLGGGVSPCDPNDRAKGTLSN